ncbi:glycosyl transferase family 2 [Syntrophobotulus glycolicus DSM 8271]|uniref:Glycosyl transferase family 2 n=1 Tax=Syntrophobotulus glycolicus (strain DSM 8271 / FlGlyR) TaxID=645991 RepID=F0SXR7_SYNGF|nr:glycosyltransferase family 2 protein [Syntrophobotulus glycolicus]ADY55900.1 glycosyl transferase family 2 [Syntrophobotulus glycolicus DSM 8271]
MSDVTAIILTMNESKNIGDCIKSIQNFVSRIVVIDSGSSDNTVEIAKSLGADVYFHEFENYAKQFNWGLDNTNIATKWALRLDADERFTHELSEEAKQAIAEHNDDDVNGFVLRLRVFFLGRWMRHGSVYPFRKLMLFKFGIGRIEQRNMDEQTTLSCGKSIELNNDALHFDFKNLNYWINKHNWYATREMQDYLEMKINKNIQQISDEHIKNRRRQKLIYYKFPIFIRPLFYFIYIYFIKLGFLDGKEGLIYHFLRIFWYRFLVDAKIYEHEKIGGEIERTGALRS